MAEAIQYLFDYKEVVEALIKKQGIHEGIWGLSVEFGFGAFNMNMNEENAQILRPASFNTVQRIGLRQSDNVNNMTVDAAEVNPRQKAANKASTKKSRKKSG